VSGRVELWNLITGRRLNSFEVEHGHAPCIWEFGGPGCGAPRVPGLSECDKTFATCRDVHHNEAHFPLGTPITPVAYDPRDPDSRFR